MNVILRKLRSLSLGIFGEIVKIGCDLGLVRPLYKVSASNGGSRKVVVSLTSYGTRVKRVLKYTVISLLRQKYRPDEIIVWLDNENWNEGNLPAGIAGLKKYGVKICFSDDIRSYKKLVPTLMEYPDDIIITCDDDVFYRNMLVKKLVDAYNNDPTQVYAARGHRMLFDGNGNLMPYNNWENSVSDMGGHNIFATGEGGCLYSRDLLYKDICNRSLFMDLAPKADDVWFYFMELLNNTKCKVLKKEGPRYYPVDFFYQKLHSNSRLSAQNCNESMNDVQIANVISHYGFSKEEFKALVDKK